MFGGNVIRDAREQFRDFLFVQARLEFIQQPVGQTVVGLREKLTGAVAQGINIVWPPHAPAHWLRLDQSLTLQHIEVIMNADGRHAQRFAQVLGACLSALSQMLKNPPPRILNRCNHFTHPSTLH